jgi:hypothetical protein
MVPNSVDNSKKMKAKELRLSDKDDVTTQASNGNVS